MIRPQSTGSKGPFFSSVWAKKQGGLLGGLSLQPDNFIHSSAIIQPATVRRETEPPSTEEHEFPACSLARKALSLV